MINEPLECLKTIQGNKVCRSVCNQMGPPTIGNVSVTNDPDKVKDEVALAHSTLYGVVAFRMCDTGVLHATN